MSGATSHRQAVDAAWAEYGDRRAIVGADEVSANVSTNRVYRLHLDDGSTVVSKVSSYGSYFLFVEDHEQLNRCARQLDATRFSGMLADIWSRDGRIFTWYDQQMWAVFYDDVPRRDSLPRVLDADQIANLATEIAEFHLACTDDRALSSECLEDDQERRDPSARSAREPVRPRNFDLPPEAIAVLWKHTHRFLERLVEVGYDEWPKIPILIDWNLGNFSVDTGARRTVPPLQQMGLRLVSHRATLARLLLPVACLQQHRRSHAVHLRTAHVGRAVVPRVPRGVSKCLPDDRTRKLRSCPRSTDSSSSTTSCAKVPDSSAATCARSSAAMPFAATSPRSTCSTYRHC